MKVSNNGTIGWVHRDFVATGNGGSSDMPVSLGYKTTSAYVNMRSGPGTGYSVIRTLPQGTTVEVFDSFQGNFQRVGYAQQMGWVSLDYLSGGGGDGGGNGQPIGQLRVTTSLNLRASASTSASVIKVMPAGTMVWPRFPAEQRLPLRRAGRRLRYRLGLRHLSRLIVPRTDKLPSDRRSQAGNAVASPPAKSRHDTANVPQQAMPVCHQKSRH